MNDVLCRRSMESCMVPTFLTAEVAQAAQCGQLARICKWLNEGGPINARDVFQCSLLHLAAGAGQVIVVQELVKRGADLDVRSLLALVAFEAFVTWATGSDLWCVAGKNA